MYKFSSTVSKKSLHFSLTERFGQLSKRKRVLCWFINSILLVYVLNLPSMWRKLTNLSGSLAMEMMVTQKDMMAQKKSQNCSTSCPPLKASNHRRRIYTEEKTKVITAVWWTEFIQYRATLAILHQDDIKKRINCIRMI